MNNPKPQLILALDVDTLDEAKKIVDSLSEVVQIFKIGSQLFTAAGPQVIQYLNQHKKKVFLDLKFHDIPNTVANAVNAAVELNIFMCTIHTLGGKEMMQQAAEAALTTSQKLKTARPLIIGVTVLTSDAKTDNIQDVVLQRARLAKDSGLDGVVASSQETTIIRKELGKNFIIVTPGIRPSGTDAGDQKRIATPREAIAQGSDFLVVGRPILQASNPRQAAKKIIEEINQTRL